MTPRIMGGELSAPDRSSLVDDRAAPIWLFLSRWFCNPLRTGAIMPSGRPLAEALARQIDGRTEGMVVELGAGTGIVTEAIIDSGVRPERMLVVEYDSRMAEHLRRRLRGIRVVEGNASRLGEIAREASITRVAAVVSSLPFLFMNVRQQCAILRSAFRLMANEGPFVQFTYGPVQPVSEPIVRRLKLGVSRADHVWLNLPPATIWRYERIGEPDQRLRTAFGTASNSGAAPRTHRHGHPRAENDPGNGCEQAY